jgi:hypothetical protein
VIVSLIWSPRQSWVTQVCTSAWLLLGKESPRYLSCQSEWRNTKGEWDPCWFMVENTDIRPLHRYFCLSQLHPTRFLTKCPLLPLDCLWAFRSIGWSQTSIFGQLSVRWSLAD